jgi:outer membrane lipoprotein-sorting protein
MGRVAAGLAAILLAGAGHAAAPASATAPTIESLLADFHKLPGLSAKFREEKTIALLAAPLVSEGTIDFAPPARLARRITSPSESTVLVDGATLSFWDGKSVEHIDLDTNPMVRLYVDSFVHLLDGDMKSLSASWKIDLVPAKSGWEIVLVPTAAPIAKTIREMRLRGHGTILEWMKLVETTGDETVTTFSDVNTARHYSDADLKRIFTLPAK